MSPVGRRVLAPVRGRVESADGFGGYWVLTDHGGLRHYEGWQLYVVNPATSDGLHRCTGCGHWAPPGPCSVCALTLSRVPGSHPRRPGHAAG